MKRVACIVVAFEIVSLAASAWATEPGANVQVQAVQVPTYGYGSYYGVNRGESAGILDTTRPLLILAKNYRSSIPTTLRILPRFTVISVWSGTSRATLTRP